MSDTSFRAYRTGSTHAAQRKADRIDEPDRKSGRFSGIFDAINENLKAKDQISYAAQEQRKTAKQLAESYKKGSTKISDDATVVEGYQDPGFTLQGQQGRSFGGLIGTVGGAIVGSAFGNPMMGANIGSRVGSYF
tara:strand:- start:1320 stop:1724 length:405 start_codon:yes stop_codon:yes gene_type:complete